MSIFDLFRKKLGDESMIASSDYETSTSEASTHIETEVKDDVNIQCDKEAEKKEKAFREKEMNFVILLSKEWAFRKFCLLLDVMMPIRQRYKAKKMFVSSEMLEQKDNLERMLGSETEVVEDEDSRRVFNHGHFLESHEPVHVSYLGDCPF